MKTREEILAELETAKTANNFVLAAQLQSELETLSIAKVSAVPDKARALKCLEAYKTTAAPAGLECGKYPSKISGNTQVAEYQGKDTGVRIIATSDDGKHEFYSAIAKESKATIKQRIELDTLFIGDPVTVEVYNLVDEKTGINKGRYCRAIL